LTVMVYLYLSPGTPLSQAGQRRSKMSGPLAP
jgi:hypothetical protein